MATIIEMRQVATQIENETQVGGNTASRVGGLFNDIVEFVDIFKDAPNDVDFTIIDENSRVLAEFSDGHLKVKNFDSRQAATLQDVENIQHPVDVEDISNGDYAVTDENGNQLMRLYDGHILTKFFDSKQAATKQEVEVATKKRTIKALFIGNSVNQDHIMYVPWYLKSTYGDDIDFKIGCYYIASYTIRKYVEDVITGNKNADYWSTAENTITWTNVQNTPLLTALQSDDWDIISMEGYFNNDYSSSGFQEDMSYFPTLVDWFINNANVPFRLGFLMHQTYRGGQVFGDIVQGTKDAIEQNPTTLVFPCGLATEYAKSFLAQSFLTNDDIHNQEGLPCALGGFVAADILARLIGLPSKLLANPNRVTSAIHQQMNVVGGNGTFQAGTETQWKQCQIAATKAISAGRGLQTIAEEEMINALNS